MAAQSEARKRISLADLTVVELPLVFNEREYKMSVLKTCYGDFFVQASCFSVLLTLNEIGKGYQHFRKVSMRCALLKPLRITLVDQIEVINISFGFCHVFT
jgi:hypothetical protein